MSPVNGAKSTVKEIRDGLAIQLGQFVKSMDGAWGPVAGQFLWFIWFTAIWGCNWGVDLGNYEDFFALPANQQVEALREYPPTAQVDIYLLNERLYHRMSLAGEVAKNGTVLLPILRARLAAPESGRAKWDLAMETCDILWLLSVVQRGGYYDVAGDVECMGILNESAASIEDEYFRDRALDFVETIRRSADSN